jgi:hypothetical protein
MLSTITIVTIVILAALAGASLILAVIHIMSRPRQHPVVPEDKEYELGAIPIQYPPPPRPPTPIYFSVPYPLYDHFPHRSQLLNPSVPENSVGGIGGVF